MSNLGTLAWQLDVYFAPKANCILMGSMFYLLSKSFHRASIGDVDINSRFHTSRAPAIPALIPGAMLGRTPRVQVAVISPLRHVGKVLTIEMKMINRMAIPRILQTCMRM